MINMQPYILYKIFRSVTSTVPHTDLSSIDIVILTKNTSYIIAVSANEIGKSIIAKNKIAKNIPVLPI